MSTNLASRPAGAVARVGHGAGFGVIAAAFTVAMAFSTVPTPLYGLYQQRDGFPTVMITVIFAAYAVGVMASLYLAGHVSDWLGRRPVIISALLAEAMSAVLFLLWPDVPGLIVARLIGGFGIGALTATATAHLSELRPRAGRVATIVNLGGLALGPLIGGVLATYVTSPLTVPYVLFLVLLLASAFAVSLVPETVERQEERPAYRPQRISLPRSSRPVFFGAVTGAFASFAIMGLFTALAPTLLSGALHEPSRLLGGVAAFAAQASGAVAQIVLRGDRPKTGIALTVVGLVVVPAGVLLGSVTMFFVGTVIIGAGAGLGFRTAVATVSGLADPAHRGEVLAALFLGAYAGLVVPVLGIGVALVWLPSSTALVLFAALELVLVAWAARRTLRTT
ncbi:MFS transporter [Actinocrispum wychmicini]|uniref:Putative MFS family arabinose efflux permease n=1 Tax=Actinocrispum wychmicini TaxID=1213861 RepID=A0A4R2J072_9PSEU|nr:MFS transporter [Actinocrispum wychmicini]TCO50652.1 putative MFS family arabinose efflux permease [Actinocrispum wychmicini]